MGGAQVHTEALAQALERRAAVCPEVVHLWRTSRTDWLRASTRDLIAGNERTADAGLPVTTVGLASPWTLRDRAVAFSYPILRRASADYFAGRLALPASNSDIVHIVRLGREHLAVAAYKDARRRRVPVVITPNHHPRWSGLRPDPVWRHLYRSCDALFALTHAEKEMLVALGANASSVHVTGIGPLLSQSVIGRDKLNDQVGTNRYLLFLGQQLRYKRADVAIRAFSLLQDEHTDVDLVFAGPPAEATGDLVRRLGLVARVHQLGVVSTQLKTGLLSHAVGLLHPSSQESFGGVLVEAASVGLPYVCADTLQLREVTRTLAWGTAVATTPEAFAKEARRMLVQRPSQAERAAAAARAAGLFSWESLAKQYEGIYATLVGNER